MFFLEGKFDQNRGHKSIQEIDTSENILNMWLYKQEKTPKIEGAIMSRRFRNMCFVKTG